MSKKLEVLAALAIVSFSFFAVAGGEVEVQV
jgi:hypothetical protein